MNKGKIIFGIIGLLGVAVFIAAVVISLVNASGYSLLNGFVGELGIYSGGYFSQGPAMLFNIGLAAAGVLLTIFMVGYGIGKNTRMHTAAVFFAMLTGILMAAMAVFTLNYTTLHYIITTAYYCSAFVACALIVVATIVTDKTRVSGLAGIIFAFIAGVLSAAFAGYMFSGSMAQVFVEDASQVGRPGVMPFALIGWLALALVFALLAALSVSMILEGKNAKPAVSAKPKADARKVRLDKADIREIEL